MGEYNKQSLVVLSENPIPTDVLIEHVAVALRDFEFAGKVGVMAHPFDDPTNVVFDDYKVEPTGTHAEGGFTSGANWTPPQISDGPADPYPLVTRALDFLKGQKRGS